MNRLMLAVLAAVIVGAVVGGCGGGGKSTSQQQPTPPPLTSRYLTGVVVSSVTGRGVDGVVIRLGNTGLVATTRDGGKFQMNVGSSDTILPDYFQVDTSGAGAAFPPSGLITYNNGQTYYPDRVDMPVSILNGDTDNLGTIIVTEVTDTNNPPPIPYPSKDTVILGRVVRESDGSGVPNVRVDFGYTPVKIARTGAKGFFAINLGRDATVLELFPPDTWPPTFKIDTSAVPGLPSSLKVLFGGQQYSQDSIVVPTAVLSLETTTLGIIKVLDGGGSGGGGGDQPPPPPPPI